MSTNPDLTSPGDQVDAVSAMAATVRVCWSPVGDDAPPMGWLDVTETERFGALQREQDRRRFLTSRILLKSVVGHLAEVPALLVRLCYDCPRCGRPHGRPVVVGPPAASRWQVSLSHAGHFVMVAATDAGQVGVDIEEVAATTFDGFDDVALTPAERTEVARCAPAAQPRARATYWVRKEAVLKAQGAGLAVDPCALEVSAPHRPAALTAWRAENPPIAPVQITDVFVDDGHVAAVSLISHSPAAVNLHPPEPRGAATSPQLGVSD